RGMLTAKQLATHLCVCRASIYQWGRDGLLTEHRYGNGHCCLYEPLGNVIVVKGQGGRYASTPPTFIAAQSSTQGAI
ncbi:MAG: recombinase family protein, partial [Rhodoferax sp.]|nr:recombinase family protein [Rhodoferax sp.]